MNILTKTLVLAFFLFVARSVSVAQTSSQTTTTTSKTTTSTVHKPKKPAKKTVSAPVKPVTITLKSLCEKPVPIYAGPKAGLKNIKVKTVGGRSTNTLNLKTSDVVCILSSDGKKAIACANVKTNTANMEISSSGTEIK